MYSIGSILLQLVMECKTQIQGIILRLNTIVQDMGVQGERFAKTHGDKKFGQMVIQLHNAISDFEQELHVKVCI